MASQRQSVDLSDYPDLVVIYLGFRLRGLSDLPRMFRIGRGLRQVVAHKPDGLLAHEGLMFGLFHVGFRQYWRDFDSMEAFTRAPQHAGWWRDFTRNAGAGGIWHEAYSLRGGMEAVYLNMPGIGFASFAPATVPVGPHKTARQRLQREAIAPA
jgi:hypothetical protein